MFDLFTKDLNVYTFLVYGLVLSFCFLFIFFYFNRLLGLLLSKITSAFLPHFIFIESLKIALLSGSVTLKNVTITSPGFKITVHKMNITLRYWLWKVQHVESLPVNVNNKYLNWFIHAIKEERLDDPTLPCRLGIKIKGMEIFLYNNTSLYNQLYNKVQSRSEISLIDVDELMYDPTFLLWVLPISLAIDKCGLIIGNKATKHLLSFYFNSGKCIISFKASNNTNYAQVVTLTASKCIMKLIPNIDSEIPVHNHSNHTLNIHTTTRTLGTLLRKISRKVSLQTNIDYDNLDAPDEVEWMGLDRYAVANQANIQEYAAVYEILKSDEIQINYQYDIMLGKWTDDNISDSVFDLLEIDIKNPTIRYGPFAERERRRLMRKYFQTFIGELSEYNRVVDLQRQVQFTRIKVNCTGSTDFRFPFRNFTHDFLNTTQIDKIFPYSWIDIKTDKDSVFTIDLYHYKGESTDFIVFATLTDIVVNTSFNHELLLSSDALRIEYACKYSAVVDTSVNLNFSNINGFLLGDHLYLLIDAFSDFSINDELIFVPSNYSIVIKVDQGQLLLNMNDLTIIDTHNSMHDSSHLQIVITNLNMKFTTEFTRIVQESLTFAIDASCGKLVVNPLFCQANIYQNGLQYMAFGSILMNGSYMSTMTSNILDLNIIASDGEVAVFGHLIKYLSNAMDNLLTIALTVQEYVDGKPRLLKNNKSSNMSVVLRLNNSIVSLPCTWDTTIDGLFVNVQVPLLNAQIHSSESSMFSIDVPVANCSGLHLKNFSYTFNSLKANHFLSTDCLAGKVSYQNLLNLLKWFLLFKHQIDDFENALSISSSTSTFDIMIESVDISITEVIPNNPSTIDLRVLLYADMFNGTLFPFITVNSDFVSVSLSNCLLNHSPATVYLNSPQYITNQIQFMDIIINIDPLHIALPYLCNNELIWLNLMQKYTQHCSNYFNVAPNAQPSHFLVVLETTIQLKFKDNSILCFISELSSQGCKSISATCNNNQIIATNLSLIKCDLLTFNLDIDFISVLYPMYAKLSSILTLLSHFLDQFKFKFVPHDVPSFNFFNNVYIIRIHPSLAQFRSQSVNKQLINALTYGIPIVDVMTSNSKFSLLLCHAHLYRSKCIVSSISITNLSVINNANTYVSVHELVVDPLGGMADLIRLYHQFSSISFANTSNEDTMLLISIHHVQISLLSYILHLNHLMYNNSLSIHLIQLLNMHDHSELLCITHTFLFNHVVSVNTINVCNVNTLIEMYKGVRGILESVSDFELKSNNNSSVSRYTVVINKFIIPLVGHCLNFILLMNKGIYCSCTTAIFNHILNINTSGIQMYHNTNILLMHVPVEIECQYGDLMQLVAEYAIPFIPGTVSGSAGVTNIIANCAMKINESVLTAAIDTIVNRYSINIEISHKLICVSSAAVLSDGLITINSCDIYVQIEWIRTLVRYYSINSKVHKGMLAKDSGSSLPDIQGSNISIKCSTDGNIILVHIPTMSRKQGILHMQYVYISSSINKGSMYNKQFVEVKDLKYKEEIKVDIVTIDLNQERLEMLMGLYAHIIDIMDTMDVAKSEDLNLRVGINEFRLKMVQVDYINEIEVTGINYSNNELIMSDLNGELDVGYIIEIWTTKDNNYAAGNSFNTIISSANLKLAYEQHLFKIDFSGFTMIPFTFEICTVIICNQFKEMSVRVVEFPSIKEITGNVELESIYELYDLFKGIIATSMKSDSESSSNTSFKPFMTIGKIDLDLSAREMMGSGHLMALDINNNKISSIILDIKGRNTFMINMQDTDLIERNIGHLEVASKYQLEIVLLLQMSGFKMESSDKIFMRIDRLYGCSSSVLIPNIYALLEIVNKMPWNTTEDTMGTKSDGSEHNIEVQLDYFEFILGSSTLSNRDVMTIQVDRLNYVQVYKGSKYNTSMKIERLQLLKSVLNDRFILEPFKGTNSSKVLGNIPNIKILADVRMSELDLIYDFEFESNIIDVTLQLKNYQFIQDIISLYLKEANKYTRSPRIKYNYASTKTIIDPKLRITGEATPSLAFLGIEKQEIPKIYIENVILKIHEILSQSK
eukprot:NODE_237_length_13348_cov_0.297381.p1 type:complete len:2049 gc:universal NODE_237_length_13348_cov_0.297381:10282-4136(-)